MKGISGVITALLLSSLAVIVIVDGYNTDEPPQPNPNAFWGAGDPKKYKEDTRIRPYAFHASDEDLACLYKRLNETIYSAPLENVTFTYGFNANYLKTLVDYWQTSYKWRPYEKKINENSFSTQIEGLNVHFLHVKPKRVPAHVKVIPMIIVHGWPGSIVEFLKIIPLLTEVQSDSKFVFEIIAPSIPGYGFSDAPRKQGFGQVAAAQVFGKLMKRLGFNSYYVQGGDWGSVVVNDMAVLYPKIVKGMHTNAVFLCETCDNITGLASYFNPPLSGNETDEARNTFLNLYYNGFMQETGYLHEQSSKPDTIGLAVSQSPAGMAAWVLEKMSWATNPNGVYAANGLLPEAFTNDELLTNLMVYWLTKTMTSSMRFYKEHFLLPEFGYNLETYQIKVPAGVAVFPYEPIMYPEENTRRRMTDLLFYDKMPEGGHFAALQVPKILAASIRKFVGLVENRK